MYTTLTPDQELIAVELRRTLLLLTDDLLAVMREFINPPASGAGLWRCLRRHGVSDLRDLVVQDSAAPAAKKTFKDYELAFCTSISSTCRKCPMKLRDAICLSPSTGRPFGFISKSMAIKPRAAVSIFWPK